MNPDETTDLDFALPAWDGDAPWMPGAHGFTAPQQAPALTLTLARVAMYLELLAHDGAAYGADPSTARPRTLQDAMVLLFVAAHEPAVWTFPRTAADVPLRCALYTFMAVVEAWIDQVYSIAQAAQVLADAQGLWDREHATFVVPMPEKKTGALTGSKPNIPTGSATSAASSAEATGQSGAPLSVSGSETSGAPSTVDTSLPESPPSAPENTTDA